MNTDPSAQHMQALDRANHVRLTRAEHKAHMQTPADVAALIEQRPTPEWAETWKVYDVLQVPRRWGASRARRLLRTFPMSETRTIGGLTDRQRDQLASVLRDQDGYNATAA